MEDEGGDEEEEEEEETIHEPPLTTSLTENCFLMTRMIKTQTDIHQCKHFGQQECHCRITGGLLLCSPTFVTRSQVVILYSRSEASVSV